MILIVTTILLNIIKEIPSCPSESSIIDIHDLLKQKQVLTAAKQALANQKVESLLPVHHLIQQESQAIKEFMIIVIFANTISFLLLIGIIQCCKCGIRYLVGLTREIENLRQKDDNNE